VGLGVSGGYRPRQPELEFRTYWYPVTTTKSVHRESALSDFLGFPLGTVTWGREVTTDEVRLGWCVVLDGARVILDHRDIWDVERIDRLARFFRIVGEEDKAKRMDTFYRNHYNRLETVVGGLLCGMWAGIWYGYKQSEDVYDEDLRALSALGWGGIGALVGSVVGTILGCALYPTGEAPYASPEEIRDLVDRYNGNY